MNIVSFLLFLWNWISSLFFLELNLFPPLGGGALLAKIFTLGFRWRETIVILYGHKKRDSTLDEPWEKYHLLRRSVRWLSSRWKCPTRFFYQNGDFFFIEARHSFFQKWALNIFSTFLHRTLKQSRH